MLSWIPLLGPIIQGLLNTGSAIYGKFKDTQLGMRTAETEDAKVGAQIIHDTNDDISLRIMRDAALFMPIVWSTLIGWDTIVAKTSWKVYMWHVSDYPEAVQYIPYGAFAFLFGVLGMNIWKRK